MAQRPGFLISRRVACHGGDSPNAYVPEVTVEVRVHYPPLQMGLAVIVLGQVIEESMEVMADRIQRGKPWGGDQTS